MTTAVIDERAVKFVGSLVLPSGRTIADSFGSDRWLLDEVVIPTLSKGEDGLPAYRYVYVENPKGTGKTTVGASMLLVEGIQYPGTHCYVVAVDVEQASILLEVLRELVARFPRLKAVVKQRGNEFRLSNGSFVRVISSDVPSSHGLGATARRLRFLLDEWCQYPTPGLYHSLLSSMGKCPDSQMLIFTNAGIEGSWQQEARNNLPAGAHIFISPADWLPTWVSRESVEALRGTLPSALFDRYFRNRWVKETGAAIRPEDWDEGVHTLPPLTNEPVVVGIDAGIASDTFAIVATSRASTPPNHVSGQKLMPTPWGFGVYVPDGPQTPPEVWVRATKIWTPDGLPLDFAIPYQWLSKFVREHRVACVVFDSWQMHDFATRFGQEHGVWVQPFEQGPRRGQADCDLLALIRSHRLKHDGNPELREHALNGALKVSVREDRSARFVKSHPARKIDALVALSMAASETLRLNL